jgi:NhaA family Na+:H+ antiporter
MAKNPGIFHRFFHSEKASGFILIACTLLSLLIANSSYGSSYINFWSTSIGSAPMQHSLTGWINDGLMTIFFLLAGLEIERELYVGELAGFRRALLPILAAAGGMLVPAAIHFFFNHGQPTSAGYGIPMATDIAFALGILSLAGNKVPPSLRIFLTALAILDDLGAIIVIAVFYSGHLSLFYAGAALLIFLVLFIAGKKGMHSLPVYLAGGVLLWCCMMRSGVHPSIAGVLLAFAIPFHKDDAKNISFRLQRALHAPIAYIILPLFALANTAIVLPGDLRAALINPNSYGIFLGLVAGKFLGILGVCLLAAKTGLARLPQAVSWRHMAGVALLGGIGFTMSIFITGLAFTDVSTIISSKMTILLASLTSAVLGLSVLLIKSRPAIVNP